MYVKYTLLGGGCQNGRARWSIRKGRARVRARPLKTQHRPASVLHDDDRMLATVNSHDSIHVIEHERALCLPNESVLPEVHVDRTTAMDQSRLETENHSCISQERPPDCGSTVSASRKITEYRDENVRLCQVFPPFGNSADDLVLTEQPGEAKQGDLLGFAQVRIRNSSFCDRLQSHARHRIAKFEKMLEVFHDVSDLEPKRFDRRFISGLLLCRGLCRWL